MKKFITLFLFAGLVLLYSCGGETKETDATDEDVNIENTDADSNEDVEATTDAEEFDADDMGDAANCDEFLDDYEEWILAYIDLMDKYMKNPLDTKLAQEYMEVMQGAAKWTTDWLAMVKCSQDEKYQERFDEISEKADKKMEELGLN